MVVGHSHEQKRIAAHRAAREKINLLRKRFFALTIGTLIENGGLPLPLEKLRPAVHCDLGTTVEGAAPFSWPFARGE